LRVHHIGLNAYLHRIGAVNSALCARCIARETVEHYLLRCQRYVKERRALREAVRRPLSLQCLLADPANIPHTLAFVHATQRFPRYLPKNDAV
ncbi:hypothetical protein K523DRAFT_242524, partial [Schizophyllum commune Tattone D]